MTDRPVTRVLQALGRVNGRPPATASKGWTTACPAHEDRKPSLSVSEGDDGRALVCCHSGCTSDAIVAALGLTMRDLMPSNGDGRGVARRPQAATKPPQAMAKPDNGRSGETFPTAAAAVEALERQHGPRSAMWTYHDGDGEPVGVILRWNLADGTKDIRPVSRNGCGWLIGGLPEPRPLYQLPALAEAGRVFVAEGEKAANAARSVGLLATTSPHGAKSANKADWTPLAGRDVVLLPDNDEAGRRYASDVAGLLAKTNPPATVRAVELPGLPDGGDFVEFLAARRAAGLNDAGIRAEVEGLADAAKPIEAPATVAPGTPTPGAKPAPTLRAIPPYVPFPLACLPETLARFIRETAAALGCDPAFVALPALATTAAAIGTTRTIELKASWCEPPIVWAGVVARSGTLKSPAYDTAVKPLRCAQIEALRVYEQERAEYERAMTDYDRDLATYRKGKGCGDPPERPQEPTARRCLVSDCTVESLAPILECNSRGVLVARDELSGWVRSFNQYKSGQGADAANWLELWRAGTVIVDRKSADRRILYVPRAAASVCGTIQPGVLADVLTSEHFESGLAARLLLTRPPELLKRWSDRAPSRAAVDGYERTIRELLDLQHADGEHGPEPVKLTLATEARATWGDWYDRHARRIHEAENDREAAALAKVEAYGARFALIFALVADPNAGTVTADDIQRGVMLADWFANESERVYALLGQSDEDRDRRRLVELIERKGGSVTARDLLRTSRMFANADEAEAALDVLAKGGLGTWQHDDHDGGAGRPVRRFTLADGVDTIPRFSGGGVDTIGENLGGNRIVSTVNAPSVPTNTGCGIDDEPPPGTGLDDCPETLGMTPDDCGLDLPPDDDPDGDEVTEWTA